ncbi:WG repeat-containing protein [Crocinitomix catalasitica]|uniref:WG repeat-containing protein n=1 Tax=Crocinitomix catalasitica TaxID=184607 RepID=UPI00048585FE|nr:WG repeat-containing protein [Crocinitomix catalasitica]
MKWLCSSLIFLFTITLGYGQQRLFPVAKNGKWGLVRADGTEVLSLRYDHITYNATANVYLFTHLNKRGLLDKNGQVLQKAEYKNIFIHDSVSYSANKDEKFNLVVLGKEILPLEYDAIHLLSPELFLLKKQDEYQFFLANSNKFIRSNATGYFENFPELILLSTADSTSILYSKKEKAMLLDKVTSYEQVNDQYGIINTKEYIFRIFRMADLKQIGPKVNYIRLLKDQYFIATKDNKRLLYLPEMDKVYTIPPLDDIVSLSSTVIIYTLNGQYGVHSLLSDKVIVPPKYTSIEEIDGAYFVSDFDQYGVYASTGKELITADYDNIKSYPYNFVTVKNEKYGLYTNSGQQLEDTIFTKISVFEKAVKCYTKEKMVIYTISEDGVFGERKEFNDYMSIGIEKEIYPKQPSTRIRFGDTEDVNRFGWFRPILYVPVKDTVKKEMGNWGLKDENDSIILIPKFSFINIRDNLGFTQAYIPIRGNNAKMIRTKVELSENTFAWYGHPFYLVDHHLKKYISKQVFASINFEDISSTRTLIRAFDKNLILVDRNFKTVWKDLTYYANYQDGFLLVCKGGTKMLTAKQKRYSISTTWQCLNDINANQKRIDDDEKFISIQGGEWYFLNEKGAILNDIPFDHALPFKDGLAIVVKNKKWGVIDTTLKIIIPLEAEFIERKIVAGKSYFEIHQSTNQNYIYDRFTGLTAKTEISEIKNYYNGSWMTKVNGEKGWQLLDTTLQAITNTKFDYILPFVNDKAAIIVQGKKSFIDADGGYIISPVKARKLHDLSNGCFAIENRKGTVIINAKEDTIVNSDICKEVVDFNDEYIVYIDRGKQLHLHKIGHDLMLPKKTRIVGYSLAEEKLLLKKKNNYILYDLKTNEPLIKKMASVEKVVSTGIVYEGPTRDFGFLNFALDTLTKPVYSEVKTTINPNWFLVKHDKKRLLIDIEGQSIIDSMVYQVEHLLSHYIIRTKDGFGIINKYGETILPYVYTEIEAYNSTFYKATLKNKMYDLYNEQGVKLNDFPFDNIKAIQEDQLIVTDQNIDYLYDGFLNEALSFQSIDPISNQLYLLNENRLVGLYNDLGEEIIPINYHQIKAEDDYFQVSFFNSFGYYHHTGTMIFNPQ